MNKSTVPIKEYRYAGVDGYLYIVDISSITIVISYEIHCMSIDYHW